jgi:hypothetical protein
MALCASPSAAPGARDVSHGRGSKRGVPLAHEGHALRGARRGEHGQRPTRAREEIEGLGEVPVALGEEA